MPQNFNPPVTFSRLTVWLSALTVSVAGAVVIFWGSANPQKLPLVNAGLNALAGLLLILGYVLIKVGREQSHANTMLTAFVTSIVFLTSYLTYHFARGHKEFNGPTEMRKWYYGMLLSHVLLAAAVPVLASMTIYFGVRDRRVTHRKLAWWTLPIWLYVSVTGVLIYCILYIIYP